MAPSLRRRLLVPVIAGSAVAALIPAVAAQAASQTAPQAAGQTGKLDRYTHQTPQWKRCSPDQPAKFQCATIQVPLDYGDPDGKIIDVAISRIKASDPGKRRGVLLMNPGGPGGPGLDLPLEGDESLPKPVKERYDLIGFDPRGIGESTPLSCGMSAEDKVWPRPFRDFGANVAWARTVADKCRAKEGGTLRHITTNNTARDMDVMRAALGERKISYFGVSYGTGLGAVYTQLFPDRADRFVLDSSVDPKRMWREMFRMWGPEVEPAFARWSKWTAARDATYHLGATPAAVSKTFWDIVRQADREPIVVGDRKLDGAQIREGLRAEFFTVKSAAELVATLKKAAAGEPVPSIPQEPDGPGDNGVSALWTIVCSDTGSWPRDPETYRRDSAADERRYPLYGDFASGITPCAFWDKPVEEVATVDNHVRTLLVQNEWDSQTPLRAAQSMHRALKGSRMVTVDEGEGHGVLYGQNEPQSPCANDAATRYLVTGRLPGKDVTCHAVPGQGRADRNGVL
ncbi:alpha/beta hydrolase [Streptomyces sp. NPDC059009]|uniref:alpha/beta hydrolase n=1 Tax=Streptomyces sp. NPDC059009 TaxID=3346694 RepID=UPI00367AEEE4